MMNNTILFVDDEENILKLLEKAFTKVGYAVKTARSGEKALEILQNEDIHVMFFDLNMTGMSGLELCRQVKQARPMDMVFALTGYASLFELSECREVGFDDYFKKPVDLKLLRRVAKDAFEKRARWKKG
ncbi:Response regulator with CheY-like receiver, AAA-type ATPase, and DNA-binding domains [Desulfosarcina cetonica]|uniref:response regulator n=1 Tax=Desulfosarcina cetonica TaxID=90730 RepID=UPI0006D1DB60|nr:response regulator [Desulfosarcina cetonica]VTR63980.1 Response regulator with CheY-like receiver, AAA-type ATPase, and DNA-binding domains [Desulfosarcina cetonica]